VWVVIGMKS
jgi:hypothetical protein